DQASAVITMLCVHIWSQMVDYLIGGTLLLLFIFLSRQAKPNNAPASNPDRSRFVKWAWLGSATAVFILGSSFLAWELRAAKKKGAITAPAAGQVADNVAQWRRLSKHHVSNIDGFVVFSSNRDGNHDIFKLNFDTFEISKLTSHPHTETYPRISPDGTRLVFARSQQPWVSQRNTIAWDVYVKELASGREFRVGENGTAPSWLNNDQITYLRKGTTVLKVNVNDRSREVVYQTGLGNKMPAGAKIQNPRVNPLTDEVAFTARQSEIGLSSGHWGTAVASGAEHRGLFNGCEIAWTSDGQGLFQVNPGGRFNDLQIIRIDPVTFQTSTLIDLEGEFSHEYWPKDSANGEYMVFGASRSKKEHEHDTEDYEIFLWKVGSDSGKATRLTFHTGNDNWPDVYIRP
ncbi:MAG: PD40 domain-containing protein, partial [Arenicella sp.]|nr:PD40 domain-containing protein [Arenicella sp.]